MADAAHRKGGGVALDRGPGDLVLDSALLSIKGPRPENEDAGFAGPHLVAVADGVGGNVGGAVASSLVVDVLTDTAPWSLPGPLDDRLAEAVLAANAALGRAAAATPGLAGMATTLTAVALVGALLVVAHVGDSRAYLLREGRLQQLTKDQTVVQSLVDSGLVPPGRAHTHPLRSVLLGALHGADDDARHLAVSSCPARPGDRVLVCSDGLSGVVERAMLERVLTEQRRPAEAATRLVRAALAGGTHDNVTVTVADVRPAPAPSPHVTYSGRFSAGPPTSYDPETPA